MYVRVKTEETKEEDQEDWLHSIHCFPDSGSPVKGLDVFLRLIVMTSLCLYVGKGAAPAFGSIEIVRALVYWSVSVCFFPVRGMLVIPHASSFRSIMASGLLS